MRVRALAPAKVNLGLFLGGVRDDGRHRILTLFESVSLADELELTTGSAGDEVVCPGVLGRNLVSSVLAGLRAGQWHAPPVRVEVRKRIPVAAGLGGGSADAAAMLRIAEQLGGVSSEVVAQLAAELGADVPGQLDPGLSIGTGAGEAVEPLQPSALEPHALVLIPAREQLSTADVYAEADRLVLPRSESELVELRDRLLAAVRAGGRLPGALLVNDLEPAAISLCPSIEPALGAAREAGADEAFVCGSGPTVAGLFWGPDGDRRALTASSSLGDRSPGVIVARPVGSEFGRPEAGSARAPREHGDRTPPSSASGTIGPER